MARAWQPVLVELTTALFACPDCGAVVWYSLRNAHDTSHEQIKEAADRAWLARSEQLGGEEW